MSYETDSCEECEFFKEISKFEGKCRSSPPFRVVLNGIVTWRQPIVVQEDWCGSFARLEVFDLGDDEVQEKLAELVKLEEMGVIPPKKTVVKKTVVKKKGVVKK